MFTKEDISQIREHGLLEATAERQMENFKNGFAFLPVVRAASAGDGVERLSVPQIKHYATLYNAALQHMRVLKFVPASGAATRMFKELYGFLDNDRLTDGIAQLVQNVEKFAFYPELAQYVHDFKNPHEVVENIVSKGLQYGSKPKGLVTFHAYEDGARKAVEEHLAEGAQYAASAGTVHLHFTVSPEHLGGFQALMQQSVPRFERKFGVKYDISFSTQKPSTDTLAVNPDNTPFRTDDGQLLFRPAGHGALIENLNDVDADIIFVKNIDNVTTDAHRGDTVIYKKALAGLLVELRQQTFRYQDALRRGLVDVHEVAEFMQDRLCMRLPQPLDKELLLRLLDRPMRVCGMVRNEGEPGGGPFWVRRTDGVEALQIAESSQIAPADKPLMQQASYFNPVDLVCAPRRADGSKYDLRRYVDASTGFISEKSSGGRPLRAQELPGLWNGSMADWTTVFVEVPADTFSPVKVVQDLLREGHR